MVARWQGEAQCVALVARLEQGRASSPSSASSAASYWREIEGLPASAQTPERSSEPLAHALGPAQPTRRYISRPSSRSPLSSSAETKRGHGARSATTRRTLVLRSSRSLASSPPRGPRSSRARLSGCSKNQSCTPAVGEAACARARRRSPPPPLPLSPPPPPPPLPPLPLLPPLSPSSLLSPPPSASGIMWAGGSSPSTKKCSSARSDVHPALGGAQTIAW